MSMCAFTSFYSPFMRLPRTGPAFLLFCMQYNFNFSYLPSLPQAAAFAALCSSIFASSQISRISFGLESRKTRENFSVVHQKNGGNPRDLPFFHEFRRLKIRLYMYETNIAAGVYQRLKHGHKRQTVGARFSAHLYTAKPLQSALIIFF